MWHDAIRALAEDAPSPTTPFGVAAGFVVSLTALIGAVAGLLATLRGFTRRRAQVDAEDRDDEGVDTPPVPLNSDSADSDADLTPHERRIKVFETFCWLNHINPNLIKTGTERTADVHFE